MKGHRLVQDNDSWPSLLSGRLGKRARLLSRIRVRPQLPPFFVLGGDQVPCQLPTIDFDLFSFVLGITKPSLAFVNHTKAEQSTQLWKSLLKGGLA